MKNLEPPTGPVNGEWTPSPVGDTLPDPSQRAVDSSSSDANMPGQEATRTFLHQLSQTLTALRGTLELALLVDSDAQDYRRAIQQSLLQAETLVQVFESFRAMAQGADHRACG